MKSGNLGVRAERALRASSVTAFASMLYAGAPVQAQVTVEDIVVTAQKREQSLQDVPISITAVNAETLQANRVTNVSDLSAIAPGLTARPTAGGINNPTFTMRGVFSNGGVGGVDRSVTVYLDGVYLGATGGSSFELPDVERIEVLRGPQGTLFGRNATAGAISVVTRDPSGKLGFRQELTMGNYNQLRTRTRVDFPSFGPFSLSLNYVHDERRGDMRNLGVGTVWDRQTSSAKSNEGIQVSPRYLGDKNAEIFFAALAFKPSDGFRTVYKFDWSQEHYTPEGVATIAFDPNFPGLGPVLAAGVASSPNQIVFAPDGKRPDAVNNDWTTPSYQRASGHNIMSDLDLADGLSLRNILAFRKSFQYANTPTSGFGGLVFTEQMLPVYAAFTRQPAANLRPLIGSPFVASASQTQNRASQWSEELQLNYDSKLVTVTAGGLYFHLKTVAGSPPGLPGTMSFRPIFRGIIPVGSATSYNRLNSVAGYAQVELHATPQLDIVGGYRLTRDSKSGDFLGFIGGAVVTSSFTYKKTQPTYLLGVNYKPTDDLLLFAKYSTGFVSGGSIGGVSFLPEKARSWEAGVKADLLDRRLRTNLALFRVRYDNLQAVVTGPTIGRSDLTVAVVTQGNLRAQGFELETTARPVDGLTLYAGVSYTDTKLLSVNPLLGTLATFQPTNRPKWTSVLSAQYDTQPLFDTAYVMARVDANYRSKSIGTNPRPTNPAFAPAFELPSTWLLNGRLALRDIALPAGKGEIALWVRNLTNDRSPTFPINFGNIMAGSTFQRARTIGVDLTYQY